MQDIPFPQTILETDRLLLKELNADIISYIFSQPDEFIISYMGITSEKELAIEKNKAAKGSTTHSITFRNFVLVTKEDGRTIGRAGFHTWFPAHSRAEIGYALAKDADKNKGFMKEALRMLLSYGFSTMGLNRIEALVGENNIPSLKLVNYFGFTKEGIFREHYCNNGILENSVCFSLLKREYNA